MNTITAAIPLTKRARPQPAGNRNRPVTVRAEVPTAVAPDRIRARAYEIYLTRNGSGGQGDATSDWLQAERELNGLAPDPIAAREVGGAGTTGGQYM